MSTDRVMPEYDPAKDGNQPDRCYYVRLRDRRATIMPFINNAAP